MEKEKAIPSFEIDKDFVTTTRQNLYYTSPLHKSIDDYSVGQKHDYDLCSDLSFIVKDFLSYPYENFPKLRGYIGFKSGGSCEAPAEY